MQLTGWPCAMAAGFSGTEIRAAPAGALVDGWRAVAVTPWSPYVGAAALVVVLTVLMTTGQFWGIFGGLRLWGDWFNNAIGLGPWLGVASDLESPLSQRMSLMNAALVVGAAVAAIGAGQFTINRAPPLEYVWAACGGTLMGVGAALAGGCTTGGFFTPVIHASPAGWAMALGLMIGAAAGLKLLLWTFDHVSWGMTPPTAWDDRRWRGALPWLGVALALGMVLWISNWALSGNARLTARAAVVAAGFAIGIVMQRSRLCIARAFREPFMTAEGEMTKAVILALALAMPIAAWLFAGKAMDPYIAIPPTFWIGSLAGGVLFGIGMVFAGGCASGALWRMGEGHLKLWMATFAFAWAGSTFAAVVRRWSLLTPEQNLDTMLDETLVGTQVFLPDALGHWAWALLAAYAALAVWYGLVRYNEATEKFTLI